MIVFKKKYCTLLSEDFFTFAISVYPDEIQHYAGSSLFAKVLISGLPEYIELEC